MTTTELHSAAVAEQGLTFAAMGGAVCGALAGTALGACADCAYPVLCGTLGITLGSVPVAGAWWLVASWWAASVAGGRAAEADYSNRP